MEELSKKVESILDQFAREQLQNRLSLFSMLSLKKILLDEIKDYKPTKNKLYVHANVDGWKWPMDKKFIACIKELDTPQKICEYMFKNFIYKESDTNSNPLLITDPYETWKTKKGNCTSFGEFGAFVADFHGYKVHQIGISFKGTSMKHLITVYVEDKGLSFTSNQEYCNNAGKWFVCLDHIVAFLERYYGDSEHQKDYIIRCYQDREISGKGNKIKKEGELNGCI